MEENSEGAKKQKTKIDFAPIRKVTRPISRGIIPLSTTIAEREQWRSPTIRGGPEISIGAVPAPRSPMQFSGMGYFWAGGA